MDLSVGYQPGESDSGLFGGNSNWRGPIWFPVNYLIIESLQKFHHYYGDDFKVECPTGSGEFTVDRRGRRRAVAPADAHLPARRERPSGRCSASPALQNDPHFRDYVLFYEYFHGDNGRGVGASHQTGWTGLVAKLLSRAAIAAAATEGTSEEPVEAQPLAQTAGPLSTNQLQPTLSDSHGYAREATSTCRSP